MKKKSLYNEFNLLLKGINNIIFDYDGTIAFIPIDWKSIRLDFYHHLKERFNGLQINKTQRIDEMEAIALTLYPDERDYIFSFRKRIESNVEINHEPIAPVIELLKNIHTKYNCFIVSNNLSATILDGLNTLGLENCFKGILGVDSVGIPKPHIKSIFLLKDQFDLETNQTIMLGDSPTTDGKYCETLDIIFLDINKFI
jgi:FMN phosphatase YigB (HAD superfamily)